MKLKTKNLVQNETYMHDTGPKRAADKYDFRIKSAYYLAHVMKQLVLTWLGNWLWENHMEVLAAPRIKTFLWKALYRCILTVPFLKQ